VTLLSHHDDQEFKARYALSDEEDGWRLSARAFAAEPIAPQSRQADRDGRFDRALVRSLGASGLLGASLPTSAGGGGASTLADCLIAEEIGAVDGSVRGFLAVQIGLVASVLASTAAEEPCAAWLKRLATGDAIGCYCLTEPEAGSDVGALKTRVRYEGGEAVIHGDKIWITNGNVADVALVFATSDPERKHRGIECWLVPTDTPGFVTLPMPGRELGHRAADHAQVRFEGVRVPASSRVGGEGEGFAIAMRALEHGRLNVAAGAVGIHRACLDACVEFARSRRQFGRRIGDFQQIGASLADMAVALEASRLLVYQAARLRDGGRDDPAAVSAAKLLATENALQAAVTALQIHGARAYTDELPIERHYRDVVALTIYEGTSHIQRLILTRALLSRDDAS